jgi:hypothetical protein
MSGIEITTLIGNVALILAALINYQAQVKAARIAAEATRAGSQAGAVGEGEVSNQVSPRPPVGN